MKYHILAVLWSMLAPVAAQDAEPMTEAHAALRPFVGRWNCKVAQLEPRETGTETEAALAERFELVCNGLWLKRVVGGASTISMIGFDPHTKRYVSVTASAQTAAASRAEGSFDAATKTWTWRTVTGDGPSRSTWVWQEDGTLVETDYREDAAGKEVEVVRITRTPAAAAGATPTAPATGTAPAVSRVAVALGARPPHQPMHRELGAALVGRWNATVKTSTPGAPPSEVSGKEINSAVCEGLWVWSDFISTMRGQPFEGHALTGYDPASAEVVSYWIDSSTAALSPRTGRFDPKTRTLTATGTAYDPSGRPFPLRETAVWKDTQTRSQRLQLGSGERVTTIEIAFERDMELPDHRIR